MTELYTGGTEPVTAALHNVLATMGVKNPATDAPYTEAMLLGIGGGLGAGYILWEFKAHQSATIVMGFRNRWNFTVDFINHLLTRIGAEANFVETGSAKKAAATLKSTIEQETSAILWVDKAHLPHHNLPESMSGQVAHLMTVRGGIDGHYTHHGITDNQYLIDDLAGVFHLMTVDEVAAARARITNDKHRLLTITAPQSTDVEAAIHAGIADCVEHLGKPSKSFALPVLQKWSKMLTDGKNKKGWQTVFAERQGLYTTLRSVYEGIVLDGSDGAGLRNLYADFLLESAELLNQDALKEAAAAYQHSAQAWQTFANSALPDAVPVFAETKALLHARYDAYRAGDKVTLHQSMQALDTLAEDLNQNFPMDDADVDAHFAHMQLALNDVYDAEIAALNTLKNIIS